MGKSPIPDCCASASIAVCAILFDDAKVNRCFRMASVFSTDYVKSSFPFGERVFDVIRTTSSDCLSYPPTFWGHRKNKSPTARSKGSKPKGKLNLINETSVPVHLSANWRTYFCWYFISFIVFFDYSENILNFAHRNQNVLKLWQHYN